MTNFNLNTYNTHTTVPHFIQLSTTHGSIIRFLVDTGAEISIIKEELSGNSHINEHESCNLQDITNVSIRTLGTTQLEFKLNDQYLNHSFQVVQNDFPLILDGILGRDFLYKFSTKIDYETCTMSIYHSDMESVIPIQS